MFWNRKEKPFVVNQQPDYTKVIIRTPHKDNEGYIEEDNLDYLESRDKLFVIHTDSKHPLTKERIGVVAGVSINEIESNDWHMKIIRNGETLYETKPNLLEIKLKDTDSVPEVWYKGERLDELPKGLVDIKYHWKTDGFTDDDYGANDIHIEYYSTSKDKHLDKKIVGHSREM